MTLEPWTRRTPALLARCIYRIKNETKNINCYYSCSFALTVLRVPMHYARSVLLNIADTLYVRVTLGPRTRSDLSPVIVGPGGHFFSGMMYIASNGWDWEQYFSYSNALTVLYIQLHYTPSLMSNINDILQRRVTPGPKHTSDPPIVILGPGGTSFLIW